MNRDFTAEIAEAEQRLEELKPQMADALTAWLDATAPWAADRWEATVSQTISDNPEAVIKLGDEGRKSVKTEAEEFIANARPHLQRKLVDEAHEAWPHLKPQTEPYDDSFGRGPGNPFSARVVTSGITEPFQSLPDIVAIALSRVLGDIAQIFAPHGFKLRGYQSSGYGGKFHVDRYRSIQWSDGMIATMAVYGDLHAQYVDLLTTIRNLRADKARTEAEDLWGTA
jgi:hypothetical protein